MKKNSVHREDRWSENWFPDFSYAEENLENRRIFEIFFFQNSPLSPLRESPFEHWKISLGIKTKIFSVRCPWIYHRFIPYCSLFLSLLFSTIFSLHRNAQEVKTRMSRGIRHRRLHVNNSSKMRVTVIIVTITMTI